ncbi:MAG: lipid-A-disaccharide synthase [Methyloligellaceae bacterium]
MLNPDGLHVFLVAGEHSGDQLGGKLIPAIRQAADGPVTFSGVGGEAMAAEGCPSLFPLADVAVMGPMEIMPRLATIVRRVYQTVNAAVAARPDVLVILDSPEFTHPVAKRIRRRLPSLPVIDYVSPSVWAWRPGRAHRMRRYVDHVLAILPFEPSVHQRLGGPECSYVGHPLIERLDWIRSLDAQELADELDLPGTRPVLVVLPGSRTNEVRRLMEPFGQTLRRLRQRYGELDVVIPVVDSVRHLIESALDSWPVRPHLVQGERRKFQAFRLARAALAASGTVTLELALSGAPMVVAYRMEFLAARLRWLVQVPSIVLPNLILEENVFPEFIQEDCTPDALAGALAPLLEGGAVRDRQLEGLKGLAERMTLPSGTPSERAAQIVLAHIGSRP